MLDPHYALAIAQTVFYLPAVPIAIYLIVRNWNNRPRLAFWPQVPFSLMRLAGGICTIVLYATADYNNLALDITTIVLLNVGAIPLIVSTTGMSRIVLKESYPPEHQANRVVKLIRIMFIVAVALLVSGGSLSGGSSGATARTLGTAGYGVFAAIVVILAVVNFRLYQNIGDIPQDSRIYLYLGSAAIPLIALRTAFGLLYETDATNIYSQWNPLLGNVYAFTFMALVPEFIVMCMFFYLGFYRIRQCQGRPGAARAVDADASDKPVEV